MDAKERVTECRLKGYCCSQTVMALYLEDVGMENEDLINAMAAFCGGMHKGKICGCIAGAAAALSVSDAAYAKDSAQEELMQWFHEQFGGYDCYELIADDPQKRIEYCPTIMLETYLKLSEYIAEK